MILVILSTFFAASGGILFEIFLGSFGSYIFGDSVKIFSLTMGAYMFAMGLGAFSIPSTIKDPGLKFLWVEVGLAAIHLLLPILIWIAYVKGIMAVPLFWLTLMTSGILVGAEIPLILGVIRSNEGTSDRLVNRVLASDYVGALVASLLFGFWLIESFGLIGGASFSALLEVLSGFLILFHLKNVLSKTLTYTFVVLFLLGGLLSISILFKADEVQLRLEKIWANTLNLDAELVHHEWTGHSFLTLSKHKSGEHTLYLNHQYQWTTGIESLDYHEALTIPLIESFKATHGEIPKKVLVVGGGDGFVADLLVKTYGITDITVVDIDGRMRELALQLDFWRAAGGSVYENADIKFLAQDAFSFVVRNTNKKQYDIAIMDLPDPTQPGLARFFSGIFFSKLSDLLTERAMVSIQASYIPKTSFGREKFVCLIQNFFHNMTWSSQALTGDRLDFFVLGSRVKNTFPETQASLPGKLISKGEHLEWLRIDHLRRFNENCDRSLYSSILQPRVLDL